MLAKDNEECIRRMKASIQSVTEAVLTPNTTPVFCTIPPCSLSTWNSRRLRFGHTSGLLHSAYYEDMQANMIKCLKDINAHIVSVNRSLGVATPFLASTVMDNLGPDRPPRVHYSRLRDGVHADRFLKRKWAKKLLTAMNTNRGRPNLPWDDEDDQ